MQKKITTTTAFSHAHSSTHRKYTAAIQMNAETTKDNDNGQKTHFDRQKKENWAEKSWEQNEKKTPTKFCTM